MKNDDIEIGPLLSRLFGRKCSSAVERPKKFPLKDSVVFGFFVDDKGELAAVTGADRAFACNSGAALMMLPAATADKAKRDKELPENISEPFGEVLNVISRLFNTSTLPHCRYTHLFEGKATDEIKTFVKEQASKGQRLVIEIEGYGEGRITLFTRKPVGGEEGGDVAKAS